ncbi:MAG: tetratricopeptide repeat protein, partial [Burkholderiaceae bacterium]|nr:tetratricopeptide repeat protein [Burkholderiaceae bacterium]
VGVVEVVLTSVTALPLVALGRLHLGQGDAAAALKSADQALALHAASLDAQMLRGQALASANRIDDAVAAFEAASRAAPKLGAPLVELGMLEQRRNRTDAARAHYQRAIEIDPRSAVAYNNLAALSAEQKRDLAKAQAWARKAVELAPAQAQFQHTLGTVLHAAGQPRAALQPLAQAVKLAPGDAQMHYDLARAQADSGQRPQARVSVKKALSLSQSFASVEQARKLLAELGG